MDEEAPEILGQMIIDDSKLVHINSAANDKYGKGL